MKILYSKPVVALKTFVVGILTSNVAGWAIRKFYNNRIPHHSRVVYTDSPAIKNRIISLLFFKAYESSEIRFIKKHLRTDLPVIELGSSLGVVAMQIAQKTSQNIYSIEANPELIPIIKNNLEKNNITNCSVYNYIIAGGGEQYYFVKGNDNTTGKISTVQQKGATPIASISLSEFISKQQLSDYVLVCDIEGAELSLVKEDPDSLKHCKQLIIELHDAEYKGVNFSVNDMASLIEKLGFTVTERYSANVVYSRP